MPQPKTLTAKMKEFRHQQRAREYSLYLLSSLKLAIAHIEKNEAATSRTDAIYENAKRIISLIEDEAGKVAGVTA